MVSVTATFGQCAAGWVLDRLARDRRTRTHGFFAACGVHFWRFLRLGLIAWLVYSVLFGLVHSWLFDDLYPWATRDMTAERAALPGGGACAALYSGALHAQESAARVVYDLHQFVGAMGMTLEFPLHLWTYRLKALLSELSGRGGQAQAVAEHCFQSS